MIRSNVGRGRKTKSKSKKSTKRHLSILVLGLLVLAAEFLYNNIIKPKAEEQTPTEQLSDNRSTAIKQVDSNPNRGDAHSRQGTTENPEKQSKQPSELESNSTKKTSAEPSGKTHRSGWAELPGERESKELYYVHHSFEEGSIRNYSACYSSSMRAPLWVASPMHPSYKGEAKRSKSFGFDPTISIDIQPQLNRSYGEYTRGHLVGSAERTTTAEANRQTFYATNIAPQLQVGFNASGGVWNNMESFVERQICSDTLYIVTGCIYEDYTDATGLKVEASTTLNKNDNRRVAVPSAFYKALLRTRKGNSGKSVAKCRGEELQCAAFVVGHFSASKRKICAADMMSIDELERIIGFDLFANIPNAPEHSTNAKDWGL